MKVAKPPAYVDLLGNLPSDRVIELIRMGFGHQDTRNYVHWDKLRHLEPPADLSREEWWFSITWRHEGPTMRAIT